MENLEDLAVIAERRDKPTISHEKSRKSGTGKIFTKIYSYVPATRISG